MSYHLLPPSLYKSFIFLLLYYICFIMLLVTRCRARSWGDTGSTPDWNPRKCQSQYTGLHSYHTSCPSQSIVSSDCTRRSFSAYSFAASVVACSSAVRNSVMSFSPPAYSQKSPFCFMHMISLCNMTHVFAISALSSNSHDRSSRPDIWSLAFITPNNRSTSFRVDSRFPLNHRSFTLFVCLISFITKGQSG